MGASNAYVSLSVTFDGTPIGGVRGITLTQGSTTSDLLTDAETSIEAVFVDGRVADVTLTTTEIDALTSYSPGDTGSLVVVYQKRAPGRGAAGSGNKTATMANAVVTTIDTPANTDSIAEASITWRVPAPDSGNPVVWS